MKLRDTLNNQSKLNKKLETHQKLSRANKFMTISNINKIIMPQLTDGMDHYFWRITIGEIVKAMKESRESAIAKHDILLAIRRSIKGINNKGLSKIAKAS